MIEHLADIAAGRCTITDAEIDGAARSDPLVAEILTGLLFLHEDLAFRAAQRDRALVEAETARQEAEGAKEEAERANRAKSEFLSRMSHELRTPLNAILGFAQLLDNESLGPDEADGVQQILRAGRHLLGLIEEVLDIARIEQGRLVFSIEPVHLGELVREALALVQPLAESANIRTKIDDCQFDGHALADRQRLKQVFLNLLSNAVKYNREGGEVTATCTPVLSGRIRGRGDG